MTGEKALTVLASVIRKRLEIPIVSGRPVMNEEYGRATRELSLLYAALSEALEIIAQTRRKTTRRK